MRWITGLAAVGLGLAAPSAALAAGGPVPPVQGGSGIAATGSPFQYIALGAGTSTIVRRVGPGAGAPRAIRVAGHYGIPGADFNGETTGLSRDGRTLVLAELTNGAPHATRLLVLDTPRLRVRARIILPGFSTVDAISPDGRWLYLIHYLTSAGTKYAVRAYDLPAHRLIAAPVIDPRDRGEPMTGIPLSRVMSTDGSWAYTLYMRPGGAPFIHALDTAGRRAVCVDLPSLATTDIGGAHLVLGAGGTKLLIDGVGHMDATVDTRTFAVASPRPITRAAPTRPVARPASHATDNGGGSDTATFVIAALAAAMGLLLITRHAVRPRVT